MFSCSKWLLRLKEGTYSRCRSHWESKMRFDHLLHTCREKSGEQEDLVLAEIFKMENYQTRNWAENLEEELIQCLLLRDVRSSRHPHWLETSTHRPGCWSPAWCLGTCRMPLLLSCLLVQPVTKLRMCPRDTHTEAHREDADMSCYTGCHNQGSAFDSTYIWDLHKTQARTAKCPSSLQLVETEGH